LRYNREKQDIIGREIQMETAKVIAWVDIQAPLQEIYEAILNVERRMQLSPLWGAISLENIDQDYPNEGSRLCLKLTAPPHTAYRSRITNLVPFKKLAYCLSVDRKTRVTWRFQEVTAGTRLTYEEEFKVTYEEKDAFVQAVNETIQNWLQNIKRYSELRQGRFHRVVKWFLDRHYLHLRPDQRKTIQTILYIHIVGMVSSVMAIVAWGIAFALQ
jgi:hypothetical protein